MRSLGTTFFAEHIGCANTTADLAQVLRWLNESGLCAAESPAGADVCVLHTCAFETAHAHRSLQRAKALLHGLRPEGVLLLVGCLGAIEKDAADQLAASDPRVLVAPPRQLSRLAGWFSMPTSPDAFDAVATEGGRVRIRVSRGCANRCSFCAIPLSQGWVSSLPAEQVVSAMLPHYSQGRREFVFSSEDVGAWGRDLGLRLPDLLDTVGTRFPDARLILSTLNPHWAALYLDVVAHAIRRGQVVPHLYCPAQSGSSEMLRRMKRGYTADVLERVYDRLQSLGPEVRLFQDILVGHPGETEQDYQASAALVRRFPPYNLRVFAWAPRPGTPASGMAGQMDQPVRDRRARELALEFLQAWLRREGYHSPQSRLLFLLGASPMPVASNVPLFGPLSDGSTARAGNTAGVLSHRRGRVLRLAEVPSSPPERDSTARP